MQSLALSQTERLDLAGILSAGYPESCESMEPLTPQYAPLSRAALSGGTPRAPRCYVPHDEDEGEESEAFTPSRTRFSFSEEGAFMGVSSYDDGCEEDVCRERDALPSRSTRRAVSRELRGMGVEWAD